ncbi:MAG TPA: TlpA disulfide reductase family protein [Pyrinomonadaceae bacterium]|jgi:peroxiredoxin|nr:TlpA disulfide reductase family protein [Pyrinomonadaceae bacterium]
MNRLIIIAVICLAAAATAGCASGQAVKPEDVVVGNTIPDFSLESLDGKTVSKDSLKGEPVVLNFFASWCTNCRAEIPELKQVAAGSKVKVVGIALDETGVETVKPFVESQGINYPVLIGDQDTFQQFNGVAIPYTIVLDGSQRIVKIYRGHAAREELEAALIGQGSVAQRR